MKKIGDLFKKKDINVEIATVNAKLMQLETKFKAQIRMEVNALKNSNRKKKENAAAYSRLKNAYYCQFHKQTFVAAGSIVHAAIIA